MKAKVLFIIFLFSSFNLMAQNEDKWDFGNEAMEISAQRPNKGLIYNAEVLFDRLNVRNLPSLQGIIITQINSGTEIKIVGIARETNFIDNFEGHWLNISLDGENSLGWVFSKYVNVQNVFSSEISISDVETNKHGDTFLIGTYQLDNELISIKISAEKDINQDFYTFTWDFSEKNFHYSNIPGCYIWNPNDKALKHITYLGGESAFWGFSMWAHITDDRQFLLQDYGTAPPPRDIVVWRINDGEIILKGSYNSINLQENKVEKVYFYRNYYNGWSNENTRLTNEQLDYARSFFENNPLDQDALDATKSTGTSIGIILISEFNLNSQKETIVRGEYIRMQ